MDEQEEKGWEIAFAQAERFASVGNFGEAVARARWLRGRVEAAQGNGADLHLRNRLNAWLRQIDRAVEQWQLLDRERRAKLEAKRAYAMQNPPPASLGPREGATRGKLP